MKDGTRKPHIFFPEMTRVLVVAGLKRGTRLFGVIPANKRDGTRSYFNDDNEGKLAYCLRFADDCYSLFEPSDKHANIILLSPVLPTSESAHMIASAVQSGGKRSASEVHASLIHAGGARINSSDIFMLIAERYLEVSSDRHKTATTGDVWNQRIVKQFVSSYVPLAVPARPETFA